MPRYRLTIAYDGTGFVGWQRQAAPSAKRARPDMDEDRTDAAPTEAQPGPPPDALRSVQDVVERAVREAVRQPVTVIGASRTDSGVHALAQTAAFTTVDQFTADGRRIGPPDDRLREAINSRLPEDVLVTRCVRAADDFDPIAGCLCKGYEYTIFESEHRPLWERGRVWHQRGPLDEQAMDSAARRIEGTHDFAAFAAAGHGRESTVRTVLSCRVTRDPVALSGGACAENGSRRLVIRVSADGFLWNMVRIIAGTLLEVGRGRMTPDEVADALASRDRARAGPTAPAHGLCLAWGLYEGDLAPASVSVDPAWLAARAEVVRARRAAWAEQRARGDADASGETTDDGASP